MVHRKHHPLTWHLLRPKRHHAAMNRLTAGFERFQQRWFFSGHTLYTQLQQGQNPMAMVIACSDSRVDPVLLTDSRPGDLFVVRNVANLVPPYAPDDGCHGVSAALEYAVRHLHVREIIVMGHTECGGVRCLLEDGDTEQDEFLSTWMRIIRRAKEMVDQLHPDASPAERRRACEMWGIRISLENLMTFPWIRHAIETGLLTLHGWYFDLANGELLHFDSLSNEFVSLVKKRMGDVPSVASDPQKA